jgi:hypothetical protein
VTAVDELIAFLRHQLDEDERVARALEPAYGIYPDGHTQAGSEYLDRFYVDRVLAEVEAKRRIVDEWNRRWDAEDPDYDVRRTDDNWGDALTFAVKLLAQPYAGREGWREEWRA